MPFFKRANPAGQEEAKPHQSADGPVQTAPPAEAEPAVDGEVDRNAMGLTRTRTEDIVYPSGLKLTVLMLSTFMSMFLVALVC